MPLVERRQHRRRVTWIDDHRIGAVVQHPDVVVGEGGQGDQIHGAKRANYRFGLLARDAGRALPARLGTAASGSGRGRKLGTTFNQYSKQCNFMKKELILIGGGGHCTACIDVIEQEGRFAIAGIVDVETSRNL